MNRPAFLDNDITQLQLYRCSTYYFVWWLVANAAWAKIVANNFASFDSHHFSIGPVSVVSTATTCCRCCYCCWIIFSIHFGFDRIVFAVAQRRNRRVREKCHKGQTIATAKRRPKKRNNLSHGKTFYTNFIGLRIYRVRDYCFTSETITMNVYAFSFMQQNIKYKILRH